MANVKLEETNNRRRLHIGSYFIDLNESEYQDLVRIFSSPSPVQGVEEGFIDEVYEIEDIDKLREMLIDKKRSSLQWCKKAMELSAASRHQSLTLNAGEQDEFYDSFREDMARGLSWAELKQKYSITKNK